jgi:hypothetical protein
MTGRLTRLADPLPTFTAALLSSILIACWVRVAWNPGPRGYVDYVPIGAAFAAFVWDRAFPSYPKKQRWVLSDVAVLALALMRVFVPPLPYVSGHTLFAAYSGLTARRWPSRTVSLIVLAQVIYVKLFVSGGWQSMLGGLGAAALVAVLRRTRDERVG